MIMRIEIKNIGGNNWTNSLPIENVDASNAYKKKTKYKLYSCLIYNTAYTSLRRT